jgi:predicted DNA-binding transcriptional regulator YafY
MESEESRARVVTIEYTNHRGDRLTRRIIPERVWFGATDWHPEPQWLLDAYDFDRRVDRSFAMRDISSFAADGGSGVSNRQGAGRTSGRVPIRD